MDYQSNKHVSKVGRLRLVAALWTTLVLLFWTSTSHPVFAQAKQQGCTCAFADPHWEAHGTNAACAAFMHKGRTSCEVEFGGLGATPNLVSQVLGVSYGAYRNDTFEILNVYLQYLRDGKMASLADPNFLRKALPILMRGAYLRGTIDDVSLEQRKRLDNTITEFLNKFAPDISDVFMRKREPFITEFADAKFEIGRGYIVIDRSEDHLVTVYIPAE
jgi:hypothetical protein